MPTDGPRAGERNLAAPRLKAAFFAPFAPLVVCALAFLLCACGKPRPLTFEEQQAYMARQQCAQEARDMAGPSWGGRNFAWQAYFDMCMQRFGISDTALERMQLENESWPGPW